MTKLIEDTLEYVLIDLFKELGYDYAFAPDFTMADDDGGEYERISTDEVVLSKRLKLKLKQINPTVHEEQIDEAIKKLLNPESVKLIENNRTFHKYVTDGISIPYHEDGETKTAIINLFDFKDISNNDWLVANQFTVTEAKENRRPDVVVFVNGLPLAVIELKNPSDEKATMHSAFTQLQNYKNFIPSLFNYNEILIASDGYSATAGSITADWERFMPWKTVNGDKDPKGMIQLEVLVKGMFDKQRFLDIIRNFIVFEVSDDKIIKKMAGYHQYHAVNKALTRTVEATSAKGDKRIGVVWHTQGSGKSLSMVFYSGKVVQQPELSNPTLVVLTDRNDLDEQLFGNFSLCSDLLRQKPVQATSRAHLRELLNVASGGIVFTTIQKFFPKDDEDSHPELSPRRNIIVMADEAHRSQYDFIDGFARHIRDALPNASFIGFTGTPIETSDKVTTSVFGDYIDIYDMEDAVNDGATVRIYYEARLAKIDFDEVEKPKIDPEYDEITEDQEEFEKQKLQAKWTALEALVGANSRLELVAKDIVEHFEDRLSAMDGKAMVVCMSRRICVELYNEIAKLRPEWHNDDDKQGFMKIVMSGSASDKEGWQKHIRTKQQREELANRFKKPDTDFKLVIVRDMWLTGFDAPCMHTMYIDKPMGGHNLMQAIARVNRVFKDKPGGLVVDYIGIADDLKNAMRNYTASGGKGQSHHDKDEAAAYMMEKFEQVIDLMHDFDYEEILHAKDKERMNGIAEAMEYILSIDRKMDFIKMVTELSRSFALAVPAPQTVEIRDYLALFQEIKAAIIKNTITTERKSPDEVDTALKQLVSKAVTANGVVDVFQAAGLDKPEISILSDEFLAGVQEYPYKNLAVEMLAKLLADEIKVKLKRNVVKSRSFIEKLEESMKNYQNRSIEAAMVIQHLIDLAKEMRREAERGNDLGLSDDEIAFYDALLTENAAFGERLMKEMGDELKVVAVELVKAVKKNVTIDWTKREAVKAKLRVIVKRILRKYGYPPEASDKATQTVLEQAAALCEEWAEC